MSPYQPAARRRRELERQRAYKHRDCPCGCGVNVAALLVGIALGGAIWLASAIGFWLTGVSG